MISFPLPKFDAALIVAMVVLFCGLLAAALRVRPELRNGRKLSRMQSYAVGAGALLGTILILETYRGIVCGCWSTQTPQLWLDSFGLALAALGATWSHRVDLGEPRRGSVHRQIAELDQKSEALTDGIIDDRS